MDYGKERWEIMGKKQSLSETIFSIINGVFLILCSAITLFPFLNVLATSFSSSRAILSGEVFIWPVESTLQAYTNLIKDGQLIGALKNTVIVTVCGTVINMTGTIIAAYPLSKKRLAGRKFFLAVMIFTMLFSGGLIPLFVVVKNLGLMNSYGALWFPSIVSVYNMIIMKTFFEGIPESLEEAAAIDGANDIYILFRIVMPLSLPVIATLSLFYAVGWWNNYYNVMIFINKSNLTTLTVKLMQMLNNLNQTLLTSGEGVGQIDKLTPEGVKAAAIIISTVPILCVYPFLQKYFVKGVMIGSVKG